MSNNEMQQQESNNPNDVFMYAKKCSDCNCSNCDAALFTGLVYCGVIYPELKIKDTSKAVAYLKRAIDAGDEDALMYLMHAYLTGKISGCCCSIEANYKKWEDLCDELSNSGYQQVAYSAALWYSGIEKPGESVADKIKSCFKPDTEKAIKYFVLASDKKNRDYAISSFEHLYTLLTSGNEIITPDKKRLITILKEQMDKGNAYAKPFLEKIYN
jgi:TPR repeat protein